MITVTIGRNLSHNPMSTALWLKFQDETAHVLSTHADGPVCGWLAGVSIWDGIKEDSFAVQAEVPASNLTALRTSLRSLARAYGQDGIGLHFGEVVS